MNEENGIEAVSHSETKVAPTMELKCSRFALCAKCVNEENGIEAVSHSETKVAPTLELKCSVLRSAQNACSFLQ